MALYVVMEDPPIVGTYESNTPEQAIRAVADGRQGIFVAVPVRNWSQMRVATEQPPPRTTLTEQTPLWGDREGDSNVAPGEISGNGPEDADEFVQPPADAGRRR